MAVNWLVMLFIAQIVLFSTFMISFFTMESHRQAEQHNLQLELHRLRRDNLAKERKLIQLAARAEERLGSMALMSDDYDRDAEEGEGDSTESNPESIRPIGAYQNGGRKCARLVAEWWVYEACLGEHVRQYHEADDKGAFEEHLLGKSNGTEMRGPEQVYGRGDTCPDGGSPRRATLRLQCQDSLSKLEFVKVSEPNTCNYVVELKGPLDMCPWESRPNATADEAFKGIHAASPSNGDPPSIAVADLSPTGTVQITEKRQAVVHTLQYSWIAYEKYAWGFDELKPVSRRGTDWVGLGLTILDSLDVLWMAGLHDEFARGLQWVRQNLTFDKTRMISVFETTIRCLGGLLAAYELSGEEHLLHLADDLGERLAKAFSAPSGLPYTTVSLRTGAHAVPAWTGGSLLLAEVGNTTSLARL
mmetsp:Transcript_1906/g.5082  ORF Transcript_1906/g.5082 Transcript_1906/m.5082 type:complete len:417 (+) Transcript_1906:127-1377(+)